MNEKKTDGNSSNGMAPSSTSDLLNQVYGDYEVNYVGYIERRSKVAKFYGKNAVTSIEKMVFFIEKNSIIVDYVIQEGDWTFLIYREVPQYGNQG
jgi:hypothetical protein